jgi:hypothetical protein
MVRVIVSKEDKMEEVKKIYIDDKMGIVFETADKKRYAYKYMTDASGAMCDMNLREIKKKKEIV